MYKRITTTALLLALSAPAMSHHGFGRFDLRTDIQLEGELTGLDFVNPHSYVRFDVTQEDGTVIEMGCEMRAATVLRRSGWTPDLFVEGARIVIDGHPHGDDPTSCYAETLTIGDEPTLERYQQLSETAAPIDREYRRPDGRINLAGDWAQEQYLMASAPDGRGTLVPKSMVAAVEAGEMDISDAPGSGWGASPALYTTAGETAAAALRDAPPESHPRIQCEITSILFDWVFDGPINRITQTDTTLTMQYGRGLTRTIHLDMNLHPDDIEPSRAGHSVGYWEGDTLMIDTIGFEPGIIAGLVPHSERLHVLERFTLDPESYALHRVYTAEDPSFLATQYQGEDTVFPADAEFAEDECRELAFEFTDGA